MRRGAVRYVEKGNLMVDELLDAIHTAFEAPSTARQNGNR